MAEKERLEKEFDKDWSDIDVVGVHADLLRVERELEEVAFLPDRQVPPSQKR